MYVRLSSEGAALLPQVPVAYTQGVPMPLYRPDEGGWYVMPLWQVMETFTPTLSHTGSSSFLLEMQLRLDTDEDAAQEWAASFPEQRPGDFSSVQVLLQAYPHELISERTSTRLKRHWENHHSENQAELSP